MADVTYAIEGVMKNCAAYSAKISTLWPLFGRRSLKDRAVIRDTSILLTHWRQRLCTFKELGWADLQEKGKLQFVRNCPPACVYTVPRNSKQECNLQCFCPWCWMRHTMYVFNVIARELPERGCLKTAIQMVDVSAQLVMSRDDAGIYLENHFLRWAGCPKTVLRSIKPLGAFRSISLAPTAVEGHKAAWRFSYRILAMVPPEWTMPPKLDNGYRKVRVTNVQSKSDLVSVIGRTCRYPVGLLRGDPQMAITSLNARRNRRCSEFTGCFRGVVK